MTYEMNGYAAITSMNIVHVQNVMPHTKHCICAVAISGRETPLTSHHNQTELTSVLEHHIYLTLYAGYCLNEIYYEQR
jgi:hypothetical protein